MYDISGEKVSLLTILCEKAVFASCMSGINNITPFTVSEKQTLHGKYLQQVRLPVALDKMFTMFLGAS